MALNYNERLAQFGQALGKGEVVLSAECSSELLKMVFLLEERVTTAEAARELGVTRRTVRNYRSGDSMPTLRRAVRLLNLKGYDLVVRTRK